MATIKGTAIQYGIATAAATGITGQAAVTSLSGGHRAETKRVKGSNGTTMSFVISAQPLAATGSIVCPDALTIPPGGATITLSGFDDADLNDAYYCISSDANHSNESELTATVGLLSFNDTITLP